MKKDNETRKKIDLNSDMGESFGRYKLGFDEEIIKHITSANVACGFHAGCPRIMRYTVHLVKHHEVALGAHPSFHDLVGFGRRAMALTMDEVKDCIVYQTGALQAFAYAEGIRLQHVKPHGALYNMAHGVVSVSTVEADELARTIAEAVAQVNKELVLVMMASSRAYRIVEEMGLRVAGEAFADRAYSADGTLVPRRVKGAVIIDPDEVAARVTKMVMENRIMAIDGTEVDLGRIDTICVHGDTPTAVELVKTVRAKLMEAGIEVAPMGTFL